MPDRTADDHRTDEPTTATDQPRGTALHVAAADGRAGLKFERYFTRAGVHPYDEVEWELRDAVLKNWRDGTTSFEQRDVEFPASWSMMATQIVSQKYFRGRLGTPERERSVKQVIDRVADTITGWGVEADYFADEDSAQVFNHELKHVLVHQMASFNSPVWFNIGVPGSTNQASACFILAVEDTMSSILNWYVEEGTIFKGGSGAGVNLSTLRSSKEHLRGGGEASGPVSFMRGADASAGTIKSGGTTRRAAKMVILNVDHPDIEEFIWTKAREEDKIRALRAAGFDMDLDSPDYASIQYQNANNSVRVTDEFMRAYEEDRDYDLRAVTTGEVLETKSARDVMRQISEAAWQCADPGVQYDTTINDWHTTPESGRINASNPCCFVGGTLVDTEEGLIRFDVLEKRHVAGEELPRVRTYDAVAGRHTLRPITAVWVAGKAGELVEVSTAGGLSLRCTPEHRFLTADDRWVEAKELAPGQRLRGVDADGADLPDEVVAVEPLDGEAVRVFDLEVDGTHNFAVTSDGAASERAVVVHNSEYMHLDNSACNLASLNLKKFYDYEAGRFDVEAFKRAVEVVFTAQEIIVGFSSYPTDKIAKNAVDYRELGLGYANLGGLLMSIGLPYDSDEGRAWCGAITGLMTGHAYRTSAEIAQVTGPFNGYKKNEQPMLRVIGKHRDAVEQIDPRPVQPDLLAAARQAWEDALEIGREHGFRNSQASVLAPTGCLVGGSLVTTDRGLVRLRSLVDPAGPQWQEASFTVDTDKGPRNATHFYVNGAEAVVTVDTACGYRIQGTSTHRIKIVAEDGTWRWRRFGDLVAGDRVPLKLGSLVGEPNQVTLPGLGEAYWTGEHHATAPREVTPELAEFVGYFMGDGSLHARGLRLCVAAEDLDVVERLKILGKELFNLEAHVSEQTGYTEVAFHSVRLVEWWEAVGFAKLSPQSGHQGKGWEPHIPDAILHTNDRAVYAAFVRGLFEADGTVTAGYPHWSTTSLAFSHEVQTLLLALGYPTTRKMDRTGWGESELAVLEILNSGYHAQWLDEIGFISDRKNDAVEVKVSQQSARADHIPVPVGLVEELAPVGSSLRSNLLQGLRRGRASRTLVTELFELTGDTRLAHLLGFFYDEVASAELGEDEFTYDLSVPDNVTYVANGFVSHNTIGLMMDCDTTGIEPDLGLVKMKKLVGGGSITIVNQTVPQALDQLGYTQEQIETIVAYIDENKTIHGAPALRDEHKKVFQCAMGDDAIHYMGHVKMMAAAQPFISGAISKCATGDTLISTEDGLIRIDSLHEGESPDSFRDHVMTIASLDGTQKTDAFYYGGVRPVREVVLRSGHRVVATPNHRLLVATDAGLEWKMLHDLEVGDHVAQRYGAELWSQLPARFDGFEASPCYGAQKAVSIPAEMSEELAFLLGAFVAEGHVSRSTWSTTITNADAGVLQRVADAIQSQFGVEPRVVQPKDRCSYVTVASKTVVDFLSWLGCGERAANKRIPAAVLRSPREMVLAFLQGLALDAYTTRMGDTPKWAIRVDSTGLLDELQAVLTNLGIVHSRTTKHNADHDKDFDEVYACGDQARRLIRLVSFAEADKAARAESLLSLLPTQSTVDVVPGITPADLYELIPHRTKNDRGQWLRTEFNYLADTRTRHVSRATLERVAAIPGIELPDWLWQVVDDDLHFSPVASVEDAGEREVYDISVPTTHAFVGNGIVNHNTVNMPEEVSVTDVEQLHLDAWKLGLKAIAIYRDNCKVAQPLSVSKKDAESAPDAVTSPVPMRRKLPKTRPSQTISFTVGDAKGYLTAGEYPGDGLGEIFVKLGKQGSTLSGLLDAFAISVSIALQYGVPLEALVQKFMNMRFEPAGMTDDEEIRFATSLVDYLARKLAIEYLPYEKRAELGIFTPDERTAMLDEGHGAAPEETVPTAPTAEVVQQAKEVNVEQAKTTEDVTETASPAVPIDHDAPLCFDCGIKMQRAGACYVCTACGSTSGCS